MTKLVHEFPHQLPNDLRIRILGNLEILENCQMWMETKPSTQSSLQKLNVYNSCQKTRTIRYYIFEALSNFTVFLYSVPNILSRIAALLNDGLAQAVWDKSTNECNHA